MIGDSVEGAQHGRERSGCHRLIPREEGFRYNERLQGDIKQSTVADADW